MKFKFAPKGDYKPEQLIEIAGSNYKIESVEKSGRNLVAVSSDTSKVRERILVVLTDEQPIQEVTNEENKFERPKN